MNLLIMGPPGAGKGTQAARIAARRDIPTISTGDIFRAMTSIQTRLAQQVRDIMSSGDYVPDEVTNAVIADRLNQADCRRGFLLDGYPRTLEQIRYLDALLGNGMRTVDAVIALYVNPHDVMARLHGRAEREGRADDSERTIRVRQQTYAEQTAPLIDLYRQRDLLIEVDGTGTVDDVFARIESALDRHHRPQGRAQPGLPLTALPQRPS